MTWFKNLGQTAQGLIWVAVGISAIGALIGIELAIYPTGKVPYGAASYVMAVIDVVVGLPAVACMLSGVSQVVVKAQR